MTGRVSYSTDVLVAVRREAARCEESGWTAWYRGERRRAVFLWARSHHFQRRARRLDRLIKSRRLR